jgi:hypothetical protein
MIRFTLRLVGGSTTWVAPSFVHLIWVVLTLGGSTTTLSTVAGLFYASAVWAIWVTIVTGNVDVDAHRDVLAAAVGSAATLHAQRASAVVTASVVVGAVVSFAAVATTARDSPIRDVLVCLMVTTGGSLLGTGFGTFLHRPVLRHSAIAVLLAVMCVLVTIISPGPSRILASVAHGDLAPAALIVVVTGCWCAVAVGVAATFAARQAR